MDARRTYMLLLNFSILAFSKLRYRALARKYKTHPSLHKKRDDIATFFIGGS